MDNLFAGAVFTVPSCCGVNASLGAHEDGNKEADMNSKGKHKVLTDLGIDWHSVYPKCKKRKQNKKSHEKYGFDYSTIWDFDSTLAGMLIEILTMYIDNTCNDLSFPILVPRARGKDVHFHKEYLHDKDYCYIPDEYHTADFVFVSMKEALRRVIKGCRLYLCTSTCMTGKPEYQLKKYRQFCKAAGKDDYKTVGRGKEQFIFDADYDECLIREYQYSLMVLSYTIPAIWD